MNKAYLLIVCLLSASFTGCIEDAEELEEIIEEESLKNENCLQIKGQYLGDEVEATAAMNFLGAEYSEDEEICILSSHLVDIDEGKKLFVNEDGTNYIIRQQISGTSDNFTLITLDKNSKDIGLAYTIQGSFDSDGNINVKYIEKDTKNIRANGTWTACEDDCFEKAYDNKCVVQSQTNQGIVCELFDESTIDMAQWTFMTYISDSDLEYFSIEDMVEMERVGSTDKVNIVVQIDRWDGYDKPDWNDDSNGDWETAKRYLITKENEEDHVIGSTAIEDIGEINTGDPDELVEFVQWAQTNYPADHYALNIWNHGSGATGVAYEQSCPDYCWEYGNEADKLELSEIDAALNEITNNGENKLDIVGFDACLMATIEVVEAVAPYSDIMIGSEILEPGDGWDYSFLQLLVDNPATTPEQLGAKIVDTFVAQGQTSDQSYALTMLDMSIAEDAMNAINALAELKDSTTLISDLEEIRHDSVHVEAGDSSSAVDLLHMLTSLSQYTSNSEVKEAANQAAANISAMILKAEFNGDPSDIDTTGMTGISILFPNLEDEWAKRSKGMSEDSQWDDLMELYYEDQEDDLVLFFNESSLIYDTDDLDQDGYNDSISLALEIESLSDGVFGNLTLDVFNNRGYWIDGIEYDFVMNSDEIVYIDLWDVYYIHMLEDGESDLLRIEAVLSLVEEDGTHTLQDWVETPYEYLTAFNESRELLLTEYVYFTFNQTIEPIIGDDTALIEVAGGSGSTIVSNWSVENTDFPVDIYFDRINLWWGSTGDAQSYCQWTFVFYINGESVEQYYASCEMYGYEPNRETFIIDDEIRVLAGDIFEVEIFYEGEEDIYFFFNSEEFDTGLEVSFSMPDE